MKKTICNTFFVLGLGLTLFSQTGIGTASPHSTAVLEVSSSTKGFLMPRMTQAQLNILANTNPAEGLLVFCTDCNPITFYVRIGGTFVSLAAGQYFGESDDVYSEILEDSASSMGANNGNGIVVTYAQLQVMGLTNLREDRLAGYQKSIQKEKKFSNPPTLAEVQAIIDFHNPILVTTSTGRQWMDRNLGASRAATSASDTEGYGSLYQWGRDSDGHQLRSNTITITSLSNTETPGHGYFITVTGISNYNWVRSNFAGIDDLWQGVGGGNNPCPIGLRIPTEPEFYSERLLFSPQDAVGGYNSSLKLTQSGGRSSTDGDINTGSLSLYWTSSINSTNAEYFNFNTGSLTSGRASGFSVRCIKN